MPESENRVDQQAALLRIILSNERRQLIDGSISKQIGLLYNPIRAMKETNKVWEKEQLGGRPAAQKGGQETISGRTTFALSGGGLEGEEAMQRPRRSGPKG